MLRLVVDSNVLIAELLRKRGRDLIAIPKLEIYLAQKVRSETEYELGQRMSRIVAQGKISNAAGEEQLQAAMQLVEKLRFVPQAFYQRWEVEARRRIPRDPNDWEIVALALALPAAIWTEDYNFFGCGCPTWTTETLLIQLRRK
ncbi:MAG: PIN domain-containing protein [Cyanophyceae cyanobacterium]